ncbi:hypothetical protein CH063_11752, partial [Colletotrichum higginsianum]
SLHLFESSLQVQNRLPTKCSRLFALRIGTERSYAYRARIDLRNLGRTRIILLATDVEQRN